jgi:hypothetical protein
MRSRDAVAGCGRGPAVAWSGGAGEVDGFFRAGDDAEATGAAGVGVGGVGGEAAVDNALEFGEHGEGGEVGVVDASDLEDVVGADVEAVALALAAFAVDHGAKEARGGAAVVAGASGVGGGTAGLVLVEAHGAIFSREER